ILFWTTATLIIFNFNLSLIYLFHQRTISLHVLFLNIVQLSLFGLVFFLIYNVVSTEHYTTYVDPRWYDWIILIITHILRAIDVVDCLSDYDVFYFQNVQHASLLVGLILFVMHLMVDFFILGALVIFFQQRATNKKNASYIFKFISHKLEWLMHFRLKILGSVVIIIALVAIIDGWAIADWFLWPLENILRTLDIGDAFEIFDWENNLHNVPVKDDNGHYHWGILGLAISFRLLVGAYVLGLANRLYLNLSKGRVMSVEDLEKICISSEYSVTDKEIAITALLVQGERALPSLKKALAIKQSSHIHRSLIEAFGEIGTASVSVVPSLVTALVDSNDSVRYAARIALDERIDPNWAQNESVFSVIPELIQALTSDNNKIRTAAAMTLGKFGKKSVSAVPQLLTSLVDDNLTMSEIFVSTLNKIVPNWEKSDAARTILLPTLITTLNNHSDASCCAFSAIYLEKLDPKWPSSQTAHDAIHVLVTALAVTPNFELGKVITELLDRIDAHWFKTEAAICAIPYIVNAMVDKNEIIRRIAKNTLKIIDPEAEKTVPSLVKARTRPEQDIRLEATKAFEVLTQIYPQWTQNKTSLLTIPYLVAALANCDSDIRMGVNDLLLKIDPQWTRRQIIRRAIPQLIKSLEHSETSIFAIEVLGQMGKNAVDAVSVLVKLQNTSSDDKIRRKIYSALDKIDLGGQLRKKETQDTH
ncbi:MAG: HEAT repeat domain-containing protein, partial [Thiomargarita sp.]|nr:HEAT repeat domain-containing protein [Thiomargarita sp.]